MTRQNLKIAERLKRQGFESTASRDAAQLDSGHGEK
jgi:hypothetical protein